jgi:3-polyprenyl-4-hydroxybenzoate decarboxylase
MANKDLRDWLAEVEALGELKVITGAEPKEEIGGLVDIFMRKMGGPAVLFDEVPGYPKGTPPCRASTSRSACRPRAPRWTLCNGGGNIWRTRQ